MLTYLK